MGEVGGPGLDRRRLLRGVAAIGAAGAAGFGSTGCQPTAKPAPLRPDAGAGLLPPSRDVTSWDDFQRSDRRLEGDLTPSGQRYRITGDTAHLVIRDGRHAPRPDPRGRHRLRRHRPLAHHHRR